MNPVGQEINSVVRGLYAIADTATLADSILVEAVGEAIAGGARVIQYRDKGVDAARRLRQARALAVLCRGSKVMFLINDDVALAANASADGVHLGREDAPLAEARAQLGSGATIGISCYNEPARAQAAQAQGADYVAFGSFFPSRTKPLAPRATPALLREVRASLTIPIVAIGGITTANAAALLAAGANALAVIDGVFGRTDVRAAAGEYARLFHG